MAKGSQFEREFCRRLSEWWSDGEHDDLFWRSSQSGGRATVRRRKGKSTRGHCGDITATDSVGEPLLKLVTFELKRGYGRATIHDLLDQPDTAKEQTWGAWLKQARAAALNAGTPYAIVVHKRDRRRAVIFFPKAFHESLVRLGCLFDFFLLHLDGTNHYSGWLCRLEDFFRAVDPFDIKLLLSRESRHD